MHIQFVGQLSAICLLMPGKVTLSKQKLYVCLNGGYLLAFMADPKLWQFHFKLPPGYKAPPPDNHKKTSPKA